MAPTRADREALFIVHEFDRVASESNQRDAVERTGVTRSAISQAREDGDARHLPIRGIGRSVYDKFVRLMYDDDVARFQAAAAAWWEQEGRSRYEDEPLAVLFATPGFVEWVRTSDIRRSELAPFIDRMASYVHIGETHDFGAILADVRRGRRGSSDRTALEKEQGPVRRKTEIK